MSDFTVRPVLLCGGSGTRLWPLSRKSYPKQFVPLMEAESLFQASAKRLSGPDFSAPLIVTAEDFRFIATQQLAAIECAPAAVMIEPDGRNTAPAILAAALWLQEHSPEELMLVAPSDHVISDPEAFRATVKAAGPVAKSGKIVTFGIAPTHAETGYGYIEHDGATEKGGSAQKVVRFCEKPDLEQAEEMLASGRFYWNSGIFLFTASVIIKAFETHAPELVAGVRDAVRDAETDLGFTRLAPAPWADVPNVSIDFAVMEHAENLAVVPYHAGWSDLGGWEAVWREAGPDRGGNVVSSNATALSCEGSLLRSEDEGLELVGIGLKDIIVVAMGDAVLVADRKKSQEVKEAVTVLKERQAKQAENFLVDHRPWGWFETLALGERFQVKRIVVKPGGILSLQSHHHRSEHWIVVQGSAKVTIGTSVQLVVENQSVYIPLGEQHRLENPGRIPMVLIEVQTGSYLGEDDIIRYEDAYARQ